MDYELLDPKNDFVFKKLFVAKPNLLISLINAIRHDYPPVVKVEILNPEIHAEHLEGKFIILDVLAEDNTGVIYNVEMQVRRFADWGARSVYYLARLLGQQLDKGEHYQKIRPVVGIHLLDFDLFTKPSELQQALWRFEMRDHKQPETVLTDRLQLNLLELLKADKMMQNQGGSTDESLKNWITFFEHWREESTMKQIADPYINEAMNTIKTISQDKQARWDALTRERALRDEASELANAKQEGMTEGLQKGIEVGMERGHAVGKEEGLYEGMEKGLQTALIRLIASGIPEDQARAILGLT